MSKLIDLRTLNPNLRLVFYFFFTVVFIKKNQSNRPKTTISKICVTDLVQLLSFVFGAKIIFKY